jgi:hypothetical protein
MFGFPPTRRNIKFVGGLIIVLLIGLYFGGKWLILAITMQGETHDRWQQRFAAFESFLGRPAIGPILVVILFAAAIIFGLAMTLIYE